MSFVSSGGRYWNNQEKQAQEHKRQSWREVERSTARDPRERCRGGRERNKRETRRKSERERKSGGRDSDIDRDKTGA